MNREEENIGLAEYLSSYLSYVMEPGAAQDAAEKLTDHYGTLKFIMSSSQKEIAEIAKIGMQEALALKLLGYVYSRSVTDAFKLGRAHTEEELKEYIKALFIGYSVETIYCLPTDKHGYVIGVEYMGEGTINSSEVYPRRILECAAMYGARGMIIAHNHPKGYATASSADKQATNYIKCLLKEAGVKLIAHYLVSETECLAVKMSEINDVY